MNIGPTFSDPVARMLYAELASIEEQHVSQYESLCNPDETWLEQWMLHEAVEVYGYYSCMSQEPNPRIKQVWERFLDYELGHLHDVRGLFQTETGRARMRRAFRCEARAPRRARCAAARTCRAPP